MGWEVVVHYALTIRPIPLELSLYSGSHRDQHNVYDLGHDAQIRLF